MGKTKTPRRRNALKTKADILAAAQKAFAEVGFSRAGIREIAAIAGVDSALLRRYFKSKARLFEAALIDEISRYEGMDLKHANFGSRLTSKMLESFPDRRSQAMITLSANDAEAVAICLRVVEQHGVKPLAKWLGPPNARTRAIRMLMLSTGFLLYTTRVPLMSPDAALDNRTSEWLAGQLQAIIDESDDK